MAILTGQPGTSVDWAGGLAAASTLEELQRWKTALDQAYGNSELDYQLYTSLLTGYNSKWATLQQGTVGGAGGGTGTPAGGGTAPLSNVAQGGGGTTLPIGGGTPATLEPEEYSPFVRYMNTMGLGGLTRLNPAQKYLRSFAEPSEALWNVQSKLAAEPAYGVQNLPGGYGEYLQSIANPTAMSARAQQLLRTIVGVPNAQRPEAFAYEPSYDATTGEESSGNIGELQQLLQTALRGRMAPAGVRYLVGQLPGAQDVWNQQQAKGMGGGGFLDYLKSRFNLGM